MGGVLTSETGVGAVAGGVVALNGADNFQAGLRTLWYGQSTPTVTQTAVGGGIRAVGGGETAATVGEMVAGLGPGGIASAARIPGRIAALGRVAEDAPAAARAAEAVPAVEAAGRTAGEARQAEEAGDAGVRVTRVARSLRERYLGRTPGKGSATGRKVIARMQDEGKIRTNPRTGATEFEASDGQWYDLSKADMAHKTDAVTWWNETGRAYGAKAPEVRAWMLDPDNYYLELNSVNRSQGATLGQTQNYLPPLK